MPTLSEIDAAIRAVALVRGWTDRTRENYLTEIAREVRAALEAAERVRRSLLHSGGVT